MNEISFKLITYVDLKYIAEIRRSAAKYLHDPTIYSYSDVEQWYHKNKDSLNWYMIYMHHRIGVGLHTKYPIGYIRTSIVDDKLYIGMDIEPKFQGLGYSQRAYKEFFPFIYNITKRKELWLEVLSTNSRAIHIYEKLGFKLISRKKIYRRMYKDLVEQTSLLYKINLNSDGTVYNTKRWCSSTWICRQVRNFISKFS